MGRQGHRGPSSSCSAHSDPDDNFSWRAQSAPQAYRTALRAQLVSDQLSFPSSVLLPNYPNSYTGLSVGHKALLNSHTYLSWLLHKSAFTAGGCLGVKWVYSVCYCYSREKWLRKGIFMLPTLTPSASWIVRLCGLAYYITHIMYIYTAACTSWPAPSPSQRSSRHCNLSPVPQE